METSEKEVEQVVISKSNHGTATDSIRYPRAGQPNAKSTLKIVEFDFAKSNIVHKQLWNRQDIKFQFPWMEYIVRFGWIPNGKRYNVYLFYPFIHHLFLIQYLGTSSIS